MNACEAVRELLTASALKALDDGQSVLVKDHLGGCAECRAVEVTTLAAVACIAAPPVEPPAELWDKLRGKLARERGGDEPVRDLEPGAVIAISCSFCRGGLVRQDTVYCASCLAPHHHDCFAEHGRCSVMGCGETRVVRPEGLAPPLKKIEPAPRHRWRWIAGGLLGVATGGAIAALSLREVPGPPPQVATVEPPRVAQIAPEPPRDLAPSFVPPRLDVEVREATVGELAKQIEGVIPQLKLHVAPEAAGRALPDRDWWNASWDEVLTGVAAATGLELAKGGEGGAAPWAMLLAPEGETQGAVPPAKTWVTGVQLLEPGAEWRLEGLAELPGARALVAPGRDLIAVVGERRLRVFQGKKLLGGLRLLEPVRDAVWSLDGHELFLLCGAKGELPTLLRIDVLPGGPRVIKRLEWLSDDGRGWSRIVPMADPGDLLVDGRVPLNLSGPAPLVTKARVEPPPASIDPQLARDGPPLAFATIPSGALVVHRNGIWTNWLRQEVMRGPVVTPDGDVRLALRPAGPRTVLFAEPGRARVLELESEVGALGYPIRASWKGSMDGLPASWPWAGELRPDGDCLAYVEGSAVLLRTMAGCAIERPRWELPEAPRGLAWEARGELLVAWSEKSAFRLDLATGKIGTILELPAGPGAIERVQWLDGERLLVEASLERRRSPQVRVFPAREGGDRFARADREEPAPGALATAPTPPEPEQEQASVEPPPAQVEVAPEPPPAPVEPKVGLTHVRPGQRWVFKNARVVEEWRVTAVAGDRVSYELRIYLGEKLIDQPAQVTWTPDQLITGEVHASRGPEPDRDVGTLTLGAVTLGVAIDDQAGVELWRAVDGQGRYTFPGVVKESRGGKVHRELVRVGD